MGYFSHDLSLWTTEDLSQRPRSFLLLNCRKRNLNFGEETITKTILVNKLIQYFDNTIKFDKTVYIPNQNHDITLGEEFDNATAPPPEYFNFVNSPNVVDSTNGIYENNFNRTKYSHSHDAAKLMLI